MPDAHARRPCRSRCPEPLPEPLPGISPGLPASLPANSGRARQGTLPAFSLKPSTRQVPRTLPEAAGAERRSEPGRAPAFPPGKDSLPGAERAFFRERPVSAHVPAFRPADPAATGPLFVPSPGVRSEALLRPLHALFFRPLHPPFPRSPCMLLAHRRPHSDDRPPKKPERTCLGILRICHAHDDSWMIFPRHFI